MRFAGLPYFTAHYFSHGYFFPFPGDFFPRSSFHNEASKQVRQAGRPSKRASQPASKQASKPGKEASKQLSN
jgi:hypothetical protein